jgi:mono/diheme cytochrome c family protein
MNRSAAHLFKAWFLMRFIAGFLIALIAVACAALVIMYTGSYNVAANVPDNAIVDWYLSNTMIHSVVSRAKSVQANAQFTDQQARAGFTIYSQTCVHCHGAPGKDPGDIAKGLNPEAPDLADAVEDMTTAQMFWIIKNGIKMSGMASYGKVHNDDEIWNIVAFVQRLPKMTPEEYGQFVQNSSAKTQ